MRAWLGLVVLLASTLPLGCNVSGPNKNVAISGIRSATWGMSRGEVRASESEHPVIDDEFALSYKEEILDNSCELLYTFLDDKLMAARYKVEFHEAALFTPNPLGFLPNIIDDKRPNLAVFNELSWLLASKYGPPDAEEQRWSLKAHGRYGEYHGMTPPIGNYPEDHSRAIRDGELRYSSKWEGADTEISLDIEGTEPGFRVSITYSSMALLRLIDEAADSLAAEGDARYRERRDNTLEKL